MNVLFPIAGSGIRFKERGFLDPKPFIKIKDKYIIEYALSSLQLNTNKYYIITNNLEDKYNKILTDIADKYQLNIEIINIKRNTSGQAETCFLIMDKINQNEPLIITNCDQYTPWNHQKFLQFAYNYDGVVSTYKHNDIIVNQPGRYSYIKLDEHGRGIELKEKFAISENALNGIFYWKKAEYFTESADMLLNDNLPGENYISLTYNYLIKLGYIVVPYLMEDYEFVSLGSPEEIEQNIKRL